MNKIQAFLSSSGSTTLTIKFITHIQHNPPYLLNYLLKFTRFPKIYALMNLVNTRKINCNDKITIFLAKLKIIN